MKNLITLAGGSLLLLATGALAQDPAQPEAGGQHTGGHPATDVATPATAEPGAGTTFTDDQVEAFARSAAAIRALPGADGPEKQQQARDIVAAHGITAQTYNAIGTAMQSDTALAARVQIALQAAVSPSAG